MRPVRLLAALALVALPPRALAERVPMDERPGVNLAITLSAAAFWAGTELAKNRLAPVNCRLCAVDALDLEVRDRLRWSDPEPAQRLSDAVAYVGLPLGAAAWALGAARANGEPWSRGAEDLLLIGEAVMVAGAAGQVVKLLVGRNRPLVHFAGPARPGDPDDRLSFWSGHTSFAFSLAVATGEVARLRGDPAAGWLLGGGLVAASTVGWLRVAGDKHWLTDVLTGAVVGAAVGWAVPRLHRPRDASAASPGAGARMRAAPQMVGFAWEF